MKVCDTRDDLLGLVITPEVFTRRTNIHSSGAAGIRPAVSSTRWPRYRYRVAFPSSCFRDDCFLLERYIFLNYLLCGNRKITMADSVGKSVKYISPQIL